MPVLAWPTTRIQPPSRTPPLQLYVLFTTPNLTRAALRQAQCLSTDLHAAITLLAVEQIPYPLSLNDPPVPTHFLAHQLLDLSATDAAPHRIELHYCRDALAAIPTLLPPSALILINAGHWLNRRFHKLTAGLAQAGCCVIHSGAQLT